MQEKKSCTVDQNASEEKDSKMRVVNVENQSIKKDFIQALSSKWPYITYEDMINGYLIIINVFDPDIIHRLKIPGNPIRVLKTFITRTNDLFFIVEEKDDKEIKHIVYHINLDYGNRRENDEVYNNETFDGFLIEKLFEYTSKDIKN